MLVLEEVDLETIKCSWFTATKRPLLCRFSSMTFKRKAEVFSQAQVQCD